jgi:hypothetical protein
MEIRQPLQRKDDGRWDYTYGNSRGTFADGYCRAWKPWTAESVARIGMGGDDPAAVAEEWNAKEAPHVGKYHDNGHATAEEAVDCHRLYELDHHLEFFADRPNADTAHRCQAQGCATFTSGLADLRGGHKHWWLCEAHRTREVVEALWPKAVGAKKAG